MSRLVQTLHGSATRTVLVLSPSSVATSSHVRLDFLRRRQYSDVRHRSQPLPPPPPPNNEGSGGPEGSSGGKQKQKSPHGQWYADTVPAMIPVALLGSAVYFALLLTQQKLSTEKYLDEANARIKALEAEIIILREKQLETRANPSAAMTTPSPGVTAARRAGWWPW